jgi:hypothetical protein
MCQDHDMPKDRKLTYSDRQAQAARDKKQPKKKTIPKGRTPGR